MKSLITPRSGRSRTVSRTQPPFYMRVMLRVYNVTISMRVHLKIERATFLRFISGCVRDVSRMNTHHGTQEITPV